MDLLLEKFKALSAEDAAKFGLWFLTITTVYPIIRALSDVTTSLKKTTDVAAKLTPWRPEFLTQLLPDIVGFFTRKAAPPPSTQEEAYINYQVLILSAIVGYYIVYHPEAIAAFGANIATFARGLVGVI